MAVNRTTIRLDEHLLRHAKQHAARTGRSLTRFIEDALREVLARSAPASRKAKLDLPTMRGKLRPGVDLDNNAALLDLMESGDDPD
jgi:hypothetical protein